MKSYQNHLKSINNGKNYIQRKPIFRSSAIFPFLINKELNTNIYFLGYWLIKRKIKEVSLLITLRNNTGNIIKRESILIDKVKSFNLSIKKYLQVKKNEHIFGSIELEIFSSQDMVYPFPAFVINLKGSSTSSFVHTCGRVYNDIADLESNNSELTPESGFDISEKKNCAPFFSFVNGPKKIIDEKINLSLINHKGLVKSKTIKFNKIRPYETIFVNFLKQKEKKFFENKKGIVRIKHNFKTFFPRFLSGNFDKKKFNSSITHSYYDLSEKEDTDQYWKNPNKNNFFNSSIGIPLINKNNYFTELAVYPNFAKNVFKLNLQVFDETGNLAGSLKNILSINKNFNKPTYLNLNNIITKNKIFLNFKRNYFCRIYSSGEKKILTRLKFGLNVGKKTNEETFSSNICFNAQVPVNSILKKSGTFKWGLLQNSNDSNILLSNISFLKKKFKKADVVLKFWNEHSDISMHKKITIPDNGNYYFSLNKNKKIKKFFKGKSGWMTVQSNNPFVNGWYFEFAKKGSVGADQLF